MLKPFKYMLLAIALEVDDDGNPVAEVQSQESVFYGKEKLFEAIEQYEAALASGVAPIE